MTVLEFDGVKLDWARFKLSKLRLFFNEELSGVLLSSGWGSSESWSFLKFFRFKVFAFRILSWEGEIGDGIGEGIGGNCLSCREEFEELFSLIMMGEKWDFV